MLQEHPIIVPFRRAFRGSSPAAVQEVFRDAYDAPRIILDLRGIDLVDAALLEQLAQLRLHRRMHGLLLGRLVVDSQQVRKALRAIGYERNWPMFKTVSDALSSFEGPQLYT